MFLRSGGRVGAAFGFEAGLHVGHDEVLSAQHLGQHVVGFDLQVVGLQFQRHMAVAQVVGGAHQVEGAAVLAAVAHHQQRLRCGLHHHQRAVFHHQHVTTAHHGAAWQEYGELSAGRIERVEAAFLADVPIQLHAGGALEQRRRQPAALGDEFVHGEHGGGS